MSFGLPVVGESVFLAWHTVISVLRFGQPSLENVVEPELASRDARFTAMSGNWVNGVGLDHTTGGWACNTAFIFSDDRSNEGSDGKEFHIKYKK